MTRWKILNGIAFQLVWMTCVWGGATGQWWLGPIAVLAFAGWHLPRCRDAVGEFWLLVAVAGIGFALDSLWAGSGMLTYETPSPSPSLAPVWIVALWAGFALTLNHSLSFLARRPILAGVFGAVGGPLSFWIGANWWHAVEFSAPAPLVLMVLATAWGLVTPMLLILARLIASRRPWRPRTVSATVTVTDHRHPVSDRNQRQRSGAATVDSEHDVPRPLGAPKRLVEPRRRQPEAVARAAVHRHYGEFIPGFEVEPESGVGRRGHEHAVPGIHQDPEQRL